MARQLDAASQAEPIGGVAGKPTVLDGQSHDLSHDVGVLADGTSGAALAESGQPLLNLCVRHPIKGNVFPAGLDLLVQRLLATLARLV
ncbi:MAG: hypothetical protein LBG60_07930 [Bifidobacteriaceae bacterium]|nr:hypothetical protein [Bifidobacteriaceae bacterium]